MATGVDARDLRCLFTLRTPDNTGGSRVALEYASSIVANGGRVLVVHGPIDNFRERGELYLEELREAGVELLEDKSLDQPFGTRIVSRLVREVQHRKINIVVGINQRDRPVAVAVACKAGVKSVVCGLNQLAFHGPLILPAIKRRLYAHWVNKTDLIVSSSQFVTQEYLVEFGVPEDKLVELVHGIELEDVKESSGLVRQVTREDLGIDDKTTLYVNIGRLERQKGQDMLVQAFADSHFKSTSKLLIVGSLDNADQVHVSEVKKLVGELGLEKRVIFTGWRNDFIELLSAADVFVHSARFEGLPLVVLTALALGKYSILPDNASRPPGYVDGCHGLLFESENVRALTDCIDKSYSEAPERKSQMGKSAANLIRSRYDMQVIRLQFVELLLGVLQGKKMNIAA